MHSAVRRPSPFDITCTVHAFQDPPPYSYPIHELTATIPRNMTVNTVDLYTFFEVTRQASRAFVKSDRQYAEAGTSKCSKPDNRQGHSPLERHAAIIPPRNGASNSTMALALQYTS